jgi:hypothetical protein
VILEGADVTTSESNTYKVRDSCGIAKSYRRQYFYQLDGNRSKSNDISVILLGSAGDVGLVLS